MFELLTSTNSENINKKQRGQYSTRFHTHRHQEIFGPLKAIGLYNSRGALGAVCRIKSVLLAFT